MTKVPIWAYYCMNSCVTTRARSTRVLQYCHFDNFVLLTSSRLDGITSPYPRENIIAGNYILADTQAFLSRRHRQQNNEILIRHSPGIGGCFFAFKYSINRKNKKIHQGAVKVPLSVSFYVRVFLTGKNKNFFIKSLYLCLSSFEYV